ncbi:hypothetical protein B7R22_07625 [Subtercola boreus]|uniref:HTH merR-type domain-containing protein n=1 Tax=Subtercola boreus TaxID=120213 RepID=A0A3E0VZG0_9MICO|nr:MerR family transcriptional regulator [Subtercola boreus]RFA14995.1 hypothetical protein B7R22_07625 [Subtercola boreus]
MRISQLSEKSGVPVATIKYYLREGLLHDGVLTSATQAHYGEEHVERLRLVRALLDSGGLSVAGARAVIEQLETPHRHVAEVLGIAQSSVTPDAASGIELDRAAGLVARWGWGSDPGDTASLGALEHALAGLDAAGFDLPEGVLDQYAAHMAAIAAEEVAEIPTESVDAAVRYVVLGTVLVEPLLLALRRLAQQDASGRRFDYRGPDC